MRSFYFPLAILLIITWISIGCDDNSLSFAPNNEQPLRSFMKKSTGSKNLLLNSDFTLPAPNVSIHKVESNNACGDMGYTGLYWTEWLPGASFTGVGNVNLFGLMVCENIPWLSYGNPQSIPGWIQTNGGDEGLIYRSYFDYYTPSNQIVDLGKGNRLWQEIDNLHGSVVYNIEYAWAATFGSAGEAIVMFNDDTLAVHNAMDYECSDSETDLSNCYGNYNQWADDWNFGADPEGNGHGMQIEKRTAIIPSGNPSITISFEGTDGWFFPWASHLGYFGIILDRVSVTTPEKVQICHRTGNNGDWHTIEISNNQSIIAHFDHGDHLYTPESCERAHL